MPNKKIEFKIPGGYIQAIFEKLNENSWSMKIHNPSNKKGAIIEKDMETKEVRKMIILMMGQEFIDQCKEKLA